MSIKDKLDLINTPEDVFGTVGSILKDGHEIVDTLSEYHPYFRFASNWMNKRSARKCKEFLQGLAMKTFSREDLTSDDLQKLDELLKRNVNRDLVLDILEEATKTVSDISSKLLGIIAGEVIQGHRVFNYNDWILINGLKNMNDWDIENFKKVYVYFEAYPEEKNVNTICLFLNISTKEYSEIRKYSMETRDHSKQISVMGKEEYKILKSSLLRIISLQILNSGPVLSDIDDMSFERSEVGHKLYKLIKLLD